MTESELLNENTEFTTEMSIDGYIYAPRNSGYYKPGFSARTWNGKVNKKQKELLSGGLAQRALWLFENPFDMLMFTCDIADEKYFRATVDALSAHKVKHGVTESGFIEIGEELSVLGFIDVLINHINNNFGDEQETTEGVRDAASLWRCINIRVADMLEEKEISALMGYNERNCALGVIQIGRSLLDSLPGITDRAHTEWCDYRDRQKMLTTVLHRHLLRSKTLAPRLTTVQIGRKEEQE